MQTNSSPPDSRHNTPLSAAARSSDRDKPYVVIEAHALFQGAQEIQINHQGEHYRLRITKNGKLILTK